MTSVESEGVNRPKLLVVVESSAKLKSKDKELKAENRLRNGFAFEIGETKPLQYSTKINVKRTGRPSWRSWPLFEIKEFKVDEEEMTAEMDVELNVPQIESDSVLAEFKAEEGDIVEALGFDLKTRIIRYEILAGLREDVRLQDKWVSELETHGGGNDEMSEYTLSYYVFEVLNLGRKR